MKKLLHLSLFASLVLLLNAANGQGGTYFREGFADGPTNLPTTAADAVPGQYRTSDSSGVWYIYGVYRTTGGTGACVTQTGDASHVRFANLNAVTTTNDSAYFITPVVSKGINTITFLNGRAARRFTIHKTSDTSATTTNWTFVTLVPLDNVACQSTTVSVNDAAAKRLRIMSRAGTDSDLDSVILTSMLPLPVKWAGISANLTRGQVNVIWKIATEENVSKYIVERSSNGVTFSAIGEVSATNAKSYSWNDQSPVNGNNYYRVIAVDIDGKTDYSTIVKIGVGKGAEINIAPNPVKGGSINIQVGQLEKGAYSFRVFNNMGQQVYLQNIQHPGGAANYQLHLPTTVKIGIYSLQINGESTFVNKKIVVQ